MIDKDYLDAIDDVKYWHDRCKKSEEKVKTLTALNEHLRELYFNNLRVMKGVK